MAGDAAVLSSMHWAVESIREANKMAPSSPLLRSKPLSCGRDPHYTPSGSPYTHPPSIMTSPAQLSSALTALPAPPCCVKRPTFSVTFTAAIFIPFVAQASSWPMPLLPLGCAMMYGCEMQSIRWPSREGVCSNAQQSELL